MSSYVSYTPYFFAAAVWIPRYVFIITQVMCSVDVIAKAREFSFILITCFKELLSCYEGLVVPTIQLTTTNKHLSNPLPRPAIYFLFGFTLGYNKLLLLKLFNKEFNHVT